MTRIPAIAAAIAVVVASFGILATPAAGHETRKVGPYTFIVGWLSEPATIGQSNGLDLTVTETAGDKAVEGLEKTLKAEVIIGGGAKTRSLDLKPDGDMPGRYTSGFVPTRVGEYAFHISGTAGTTSRGDYGQITFRDWAPVGGGESGYIVVDPNDANSIYAGSTYGEMHRFDRRTGQSHVISPLAISSFGTPISKAKYRFTWTSPLAFSPKEPGVLYMGSQYLLKTSDHGLNWQPISPDLTGADPKAANATGPVTVENAKARAYGVIYTISPSPINSGAAPPSSSTRHDLDRRRYGCDFHYP